jgi:hypothetical protein
VIEAKSSPEAGLGRIGRVSWLLFKEPLYLCLINVHPPIGVIFPSSPIENLSLSYGQV